MVAVCSLILTSSRWMRVAGIPTCGGMLGDEPQNALTNRYGKVRSRPHDAVTRVYDAAGNVALLQLSEDVGRIHGYEGQRVDPRYRSVNKFHTPKPTYAGLA